MADENTKKDSFNRIGQKGGDRYVRLPTSKVKGAMSLKPKDIITLEDVEEADIFPEANGDVEFNPEGAEIIKDPETYEKEKKKDGDYGLVVFDPN